MANAIQQNPIYLDTVMTSSFKALLQAALDNGYSPSTLRISKIVWHAPALAGDTYQITDGSGTVLFEGIAVGPNTDVVLDFNVNPKLVRDFQLTQISSGSLLIYTR